MSEPQRREITDVRALQALAHPVRLDLLGHLLTHGPRTASQCAAALGGSASNYSYHLRHLARFGFVEPLDAQDRRERPWRATATGFTLGGGSSAPANLAAEHAVRAGQVDRGTRLAHEFLRGAGAGAVEPEWREAATFNSYALLVTPVELAELTERLDELIRPLRGAVRADPPPDARSVHLNLDAFPLPEHAP